MAESQSKLPKPLAASKPLQAVPELLFAHEVASELRVSVSTVKRMIAKGELRSLKLAGHARVSRFDLQAFLREARAAGPTRAPEAPPAPEGRVLLAQAVGAALLDLLHDSDRWLVLRGPNGYEKPLGVSALIQVDTEQPPEVRAAYLTWIHDGAAPTPITELLEPAPEPPPPA